MLGFLFTTAGIAIIVLLIVIGIGAYLIYTNRPIKQVLLLRPRDKRGMQIPIVRETDSTLECKKVGDVARRFIKAGCAWTFVIGRQVTTRFFGMEGTAYTAIIKNKEEEKVSLEEALRSLWGDKFYEDVPEKQKSIIEKHKWGLTVEVEPIEEGDDMISIASDIVQDASDSIILDKLAGAQKTSTTSQIYQFLMGAVTGALLVFFAATQGWILI